MKLEVGKSSTASVFRPMTVALFICLCRPNGLITVRTVGRVSLYSWVSIPVGLITVRAVGTVSLYSRE